MSEDDNDASERGGDGNMDVDDDMGLWYTNVVVAANLDVKDVNTRRLVGYWPGLRYDHRTFSSVLWQQRRPNATVQLYKNGHMACMGARTRMHALLAITKAVRLLRQYAVKFGESPHINMVGFKPTNLVSSIELGHHVDLHALWRDYKKIVTFNPDGIKAATLRAKHLNLTPPSRMAFLIFHTSKINVVGASDDEETRRVTDYVVNNIIRHYLILPGQTHATPGPTRLIVDYDRVYAPRVDTDAAADPSHSPPDAGPGNADDDVEFTLTMLTRTTAASIHPAPAHDDDAVDYSAILGDAARALGMPMAPIDKKLDM